MSTRILELKALTLLSVLITALALLAAPLEAGAQSSAKVYRIGYVRAEVPPAVDIEAFREGLREYGYVEGRNVVIEFRWADGSEDRLRSLVAELLHLKVDLIVTSAPAATRVAREATSTIPIVMVLVADPVAFGFVAGHARPGGNVTGFAFLLPEISGKRLELLKEAAPELARVAVLWNAANPYKEYDLREVQTVAETFRVAVDTVPVREPKGFEDPFKAAVARGARSDHAGGSLHDSSPRIDRGSCPQAQAAGGPRSEAFRGRGWADVVWTGSCGSEQACGRLCG